MLMAAGHIPGVKEIQMKDYVTIRGNVGGDPVRHTTAGGASVIHFRLASGQGYHDKRSGSWVETGTNWYSVSAFRQLAENAKASLRSGDPVIVTGRLKLNEWENNGRHGFVDLEAESIGHDLNRGTSNFLRTPRAAAPAATPPAPENAPADASDIDEPTGDDDAWVVGAGMEQTGAQAGATEPADEHPAYAQT